MSAKRVCKCGCGRSIDHKHPNAKFLNQRHKDKYWNRENPRGQFGYRNPNNPLSSKNPDSPIFDPEWDRHPHDIDQD